jgi:hypothetical protein
MLQIVTGVVLSYWMLPPFAQAAHILLASLVFGAQFYLLLNLQRSAGMLGGKDMSFKDFKNLVKLRLTLLVVFSASISFLIGSKVDNEAQWLYRLEPY